jgi:hypothetical protein
MLCYFVNRMWPLRETRHRAGTAALSALGCYLSSLEIERQRWDSCFGRDCIALPASITSCFGGDLEGGRARSSRLRSTMPENARELAKSASFGPRDRRSAVSVDYVGRWSAGRSAAAVLNRRRRLRKVRDRELGASGLIVSLRLQDCLTIFQGNEYLQCWSRMRRKVGLMRGLLLRRLAP